MLIRCTFRSSSDCCQPRHGSALAAACLGACLALFAGCEQAGKPLDNLVPVSGTVSLAGAPLPAGIVFFVPEASSGQPATGEIKEGAFTMVTTVSSPGVIAGRYKVRIEATEASGQPPAPPPTITGQPHVPPKSLIPKEYNSVETSGLTIEVRPGMAPPKFDLPPGS